MPASPMPIPSTTSTRRWIGWKRWWRTLKSKEWFSNKVKTNVHCNIKEI
jgi:hypothetical protein